MSKRPKRKKKSSRSSQTSGKKHQPRSVTILHEDRDLLIVDKMGGLLTIASDKERKRTACAYLNDYVRKGVVKSRKRVYIVHRLDRETSGILVVAKEESAKDFLRQEWRKFKKTYVAVVHGKLPQSEGKLSSYLVESSVHKMYSTKDSQKGKKAEMFYRVIDETKRYSLVEIDLYIARKHQIRVLLADIGCPIVGDKKYGSGEKGAKRLALHARSIEIIHPFSKKQMSFETEIPSYFEFLMHQKEKKPQEATKTSEHPSEDE